MSAARPDGVDDDPVVRAALLLLNNASAQETSLLEAARFDWLLREAAIASRVDDRAFLIAFDETSLYDGVHFQWFRARLERFVYIDRVVVAARARQQGLGRALYLDVFERARRGGHKVVTCEVNQTPANPISDAFHARLGFQPVGTGLLEGGNKIVSYLARHF